MLTPNSQKDAQTNALLEILACIKSLEPKLGAYIEHFYDKDDTIIMKLTNGTLKIKEPLLEKQLSEAELSESELNKIAKTFVTGIFS